MAGRELRESQVFTTIEPIVIDLEDSISGTEPKRNVKGAKPKGKASAKSKPSRAKAKAKAKAKAPGKRKQRKAKKTKKPKVPKVSAKGSATTSRRKALRFTQRRQSIKQKKRFDVQDWDGSSENVTPNAIEVDTLLGGPSQISQNLSSWIARQLNLDAVGVAGAVRLFQEGSTLPFIARYRKENTGSMNEEDLRRVEREMARVKDLEKRRGRVAMSLNRGKHLTPEVLETLLQAETMEDLDALWAPFKAKRQTRAQQAKSKGLEPLATLLQESAKSELLGVSALTTAPIDLSNDTSPMPVDLPPLEAAERFVGNDVPDVAAALAAARDILAEQLAHRPDLRQLARDMLEKRVKLTSRRRSNSDTGEEEQRFKTYWDFEATMQQIKAHQFLAIQRGEAAKCLSIHFVVSPDDTQLLLDRFVDMFLGLASPNSRIVDAPTPLRATSGKVMKKGRGGRFLSEIRMAMEDGFKRLMLPSLQREWRRKLKERAEDEAFDTFRRNLKKKLLSPPLRLHPTWGSDACPTTAIVGVDPAFRTGCKCALISVTGQVLCTKTIFPHPPSNGCFPEMGASAAKAFMELLDQAMMEGPPAKRRRVENDVDLDGEQYRVVCSIGNGTASRETEAWLRKEFALKKGLGYAIVDEAGASVYSASPLGAAELPDLDVSLRGAVSIARRLLDPLSELVKIDPRSIGVGLYQHDVDQKRLAEELRGATMSCVNSVGVDLNTASPALLEHVAGLTGTLARSILKYREEKGHFKTRHELLQIKGLGPKSFQQAAGFLRIFGGTEPLDALPIHPESYVVAKSLQDPSVGAANADVETLASKFGIGFETMRDICSALAEGATSDPRRQEAPLRIKEPGKISQVGSSAIDAQEAGITAAQLIPKMRLLGVVKNVVAFGAFIDIGVGCDGLLHISNYPVELRSSSASLSVNDQVEVTVVSSERRQERGKDKWRIGLTMKSVSLPDTAH